jgi:wyosine [tRNA(Phe)-imidazoG37] synthetase (radical SAM superfamily)
MTRGIYLRANGEINCYCSTGEQISLTKLPLDHVKYDFVADYYLKDRFRHIRDSMKENKLPFPTYCLKCNYLDPFEEFYPEEVEREIEWAHLEAAAVCNLRCPFCVHGIPKEVRNYDRSAPHLLPAALYEKVLRDVREAGLSIKWMYFSGRGEPGLHPRLWEMVAKAKDMFHTNFLVNTNGNISYTDQIVDSGLDKIKIALESLDQEIYGRYRINGKVTNIQALTEGIAGRKHKVSSSTPQVIWQKVMFNYNDSDEDLIAYQKAAARCGVDKILLVFTWTDNFSTRKPADVPNLFENIEVLDTLQRDNIPLPELRRSVADLKDRRSLPEIVWLLSRILHWFELGTENRDHYDAFANLPVYEEKLLSLRKNDPHLAEYVSAMRWCLESLADCYYQKGESDEGERYRNWADKVTRLE